MIPQEYRQNALRVIRHDKDDFYQPDCEFCGKLLPCMIMPEDSGLGCSVVCNDCWKIEVEDEEEESK